MGANLRPPAGQPRSHRAHAQHDHAREPRSAEKALHDDLALLELRPRRGHDLRRTFITLAQVDGARKDILEAISHGPRGDIVSVYTTFPWPVLCAEVRKLKIEPVVVRIPRGLVDKTRYTAVTGEQSSRNRWTKRATPAGFEIESRDFPKTKRDATLAGKSLSIRCNGVLSQDESCRLESSRDAESRHSDGTLNFVIVPRGPRGLL